MSRLPRPLTLLLACMLLAFTAAACGRDDDDLAGSGTTTAAPAATAAETTAAAPAADGCRPADAPKPKDGEVAAPTGELDPSKTYVATVKTNCGSFQITLDVKRAPKTSNSFDHLAEEGFYDGTTFHRIVPGFVIQGGDPAGDGTGGPGYSVEEAPPSDVQYTKGVVAMAKTAAEPAGTSGSQFYVVTGDDAGLPPEYALLGEVTAGMDVVDTIAGVERDSVTEKPVTPVVIESVTVKAS